MGPRWRAIAFTALLAIAAGCGVVTITERDDVTQSMRTLSQEQAMSRVEQHIANAVAALPTNPRLEEQSTTQGLPCDDPSDQGPLGRVTVAKTYWLRDLPMSNTTDVIDAMHSYWITHDYRVLADKRDRAGLPALFVESNRDAFRMAMQTSVQGDVSISSTSPCVWPEGTPPPGAVPG